MPILGITLTAILPFTSLLVALSFIFGGSAATTFNCIVFIFANHPYDTGDRVNIDGENLIVDELNLLNTVFVRSGRTVLI
jgi:mechanosensitive ion channel protein 4/5/6/7/8/9/10